MFFFLPYFLYDYFWPDKNDFISYLGIYINMIDGTDKKMAISTQLPITCHRPDCFSFGSQLGQLLLWFWVWINVVFVMVIEG